MITLFRWYMTKAKQIKLKWMLTSALDKFITLALSDPAMLAKEIDMTARGLAKFNEAFMEGFNNKAKEDKESESGE